MKITIDKGVALVCAIVKEFEQRYPKVKIGKTVLQKMMYLLQKRLNYDLNYSLYHYGPYSSLVSLLIDYAEEQKFIDVKWSEKNGYTISSNKEVSGLNERERQEISRLVEKYGSLSPIGKKLSIIATWFYVKDEFNVSESDAIEIVASIKKKNYKRDYVEKTVNNLLNHDPH